MNSEKQLAGGIVPYTYPEWVSLLLWAVTVRAGAWRGLFLSVICVAVRLITLSTHGM